MKHPAMIFALLFSAAGNASADWFDFLIWAISSAIPGRGKITGLLAIHKGVVMLSASQKAVLTGAAQLTSIWIST
ncbi:MAG: hypothetical protein HZT40_17385 [Candidatus Thiothrix singaporensis]|uniref:Uncharacterized protein n=1 Tax=Candidatus Thiothrix singaporensis TaxID=2799669 RepID=A0A7L6AMC9_9GAMM|nr:MAG: hypothetical protein HZT40_17385 [Candidatus Thiothrix singaporensis]